MLLNDNHFHCLYL